MQKAYGLVLVYVLYPFRAPGNCSSCYDYVFGKSFYEAVTCAAVCDQFRFRGGRNLPVKQLDHACLIYLPVVLENSSAGAGNLSGDSLGMPHSLDCGREAIENGRHFLIHFSP